MTDLSITDLQEILGDLTPQQIAAAVEAMSPDEAQQMLDEWDESPFIKPRGPLEQAQALDPLYRPRDHLRYLSERLRLAVEKVERGESHYMVVSMPPRSGKSQLTSVYTCAWLMSTHPEWPIGLISHDPTLASNWGRDVRTIIEEHATQLDVTLRRDAGAVTDWKTTKNGGVLSRSVRQSITGRGFKVLIVDDAVKDYADAHSEANRNWLWNWWTANASTRKNGAWLVIFIGTRWHEDDVIGRLLSTEYEGDPKMWESIKFPAIAEDHDVLGRVPGQPLLSPIEDETVEQALERWAGVKAMVGTYTWNALYQQRPSPAKGMIFNADWWRFWTVNPQFVSKAHESGCEGGACACPPDGRVVLLDPDTDLAGARWSDSWDMAFKATTSSDYVVGQRWAQLNARRYLMHQYRARATFTQTLKVLRVWTDPDDPEGDAANQAPYSDRTHEHFVEDKANGTAVLDAIKEVLPGFVAVNPTESKEARARAVTPEPEAGNVFLPYPGDPGNEWVADLLSELREFPAGAHDDQVDALTQYLQKVRQPVKAGVVNPNNVVTSMQGRRIGQVAGTQRRRTGTGMRRGTGR